MDCMGNVNERIIRDGKGRVGLVVRNIYEPIGCDWYFQPTGERGETSTGIFRAANEGR